jgi:hypothetical protein
MKKEGEREASKDNALVFLFYALFSGLSLLCSLHPWVL